MRRPRFRSDYLPVRLAGEQGDYLVVVGETRNLLIEDPASADLAELLDGSRSLGELTEALAPRHSVGALARALRTLRGLDLLAPEPCAVPPGRAAGWDARGVAPDRAERWLREGRVLLVDAGAPTLPHLAAQLSAYGMTVTSVPVDAPDLAARLARTTGTAPAGRPGGELVVVAPGSMIDPRLAAVNAACLAAGVSWLLVRPHGNVVLLGPHLVPGGTGCWECLRQRWRDNEDVANYLAQRRPGAGRVTPAWAALPTTAGVAAGLLATELPVLGELGRSPRLTGQMFALDTRDLTASTHQLVRQPQCPACGRPDLMLSRDSQITVDAERIRSDMDSGYRTVAAAETCRRLERHVSRYLGAVTRLTPTAGNDSGVMYSFTAGHNFAVAHHPAMLRGNLRGLAGGKGRTETQAKVSAIGEAIERYCGVWRGDRPTHRASFGELGPRRAVRLADLLLFSPRQYAERVRHNATASRFNHVPRPLDDGTELDWTTGWSLTFQRPRDVPAAYCWYGHPDTRRLDACATDSNGCAAGNSTGEAILQGFHELVERDSVALWWYHRSRVPGVDLDSFDDPWVTMLRRHYDRELNRRLWVLDITADLGIPAFAAVSARDGQPAEDVLVGFGAHAAAPVALSRALTEVNQFLPLVGDSSRYGVTEPETVRWLTTVRVGEQPWLCPAPDLPQTTVDTYRTGSGRDVAEEVDNCVRVAAAAGLEVIVVDQSRPELDLAVVKVIVPGLRHFWRRLGPGRLWEVPRRLGREPRAADEDAANPLSVFF